LSGRRCALSIKRQHLPQDRLDLPDRDILLRVDEVFFANSQARNILALYTDLDDVLKRADAFIVVSERILSKIENP